MADQNEIERFKTDFMYCHQRFVQLMGQKPPKRKYRNYAYERNNMMKDGMWYALSNGEYVPQYKQLSKFYNVPEDCLKKWRTQLLKDSNWVPDQGHAEKQRMFTPKKEAEIANTFLKCADNGIQMSNSTARYIFLHQDPQTLENQSVETQNRKKFRATDHYIRRFRKRHHISRLRAHLKRRPAADPEKITIYRDRLLELLRNSLISGDHVLNCDETFWHQNEQSPYTWGRTGQDNVHIYTNTNDKAGTTVLATIDYTGQKLPLVFIGKGKTRQCEMSQFGFSNPIGQSVPNPYSGTIHYTEHSKSGWMNSDIWTKYLANLRNLRPYNEQYPENAIQNKLYLTCDSFPTHHDGSSEIEAEKNNIELIPIPKGCTDECQALDRRLFGSIKQEARAHTSQVIANSVLDSIKSNVPVKINPQTKKESCELLINIWDKLPKSQIEKAWSLSLHGRENGDNEDV